MRCHYEILEVTRTADDAEIKKSYRKLALKWHPDKNPDNIKECTEYFALIQQAYDVLSDPHERAFYDRHRDSFLKGGYDGEYKEDSIDLFQYFTVSCFKGFGDDDKGFFGVYRRVFDNLAAEDYDFIDDPSERYPSFGNSESDYDRVCGPFYGFWSSFNTARSFAWLEKYDIRDATNRYVARQIESENKKLRDLGRAERSEQVRELVAFVRKRDPRVRKYREYLEEKQLEAKKKQEENRRQQILKNQRDLEEYLDDEIAAAERKAHLEQVSLQMAENLSCSDEDEEGDDELHCVVCNKFFKTMNAKVNHENSKQHKKQLTELRKHMKEEDALLFETKAADQQAAVESKAKNKRRERKKNGWNDDEETINEPTPSDDVNELVEDLMKVSVSAVEVDVQEVIEETAEKKKKKRRADKSKVTNADEPVDNSPPENEEGTGPRTGRCDRCKEVFESRSKLFDHLRLTGHSTLLVNKKVQPASKNKKNRR